MDREQQKLEENSEVPPPTPREKLMLLVLLQSINIIIGAIAFTKWWRGGQVPSNLHKVLFFLFPDTDFLLLGQIVFHMAVMSLLLYHMVRTYKTIEYTPAPLEENSAQELEPMDNGE